MAYAQISYPNTKLAKGPLTLAEAGCFVTAFSNILRDKFGVTIAPDQMNALLLQKGGFVGDLIAGWGAISKVRGDISVASVGGYGWPASNNSIVQFNYISSRTGNRITHYCEVYDAAKHMIVDSWDGKVKVSPYGVPVASATYRKYVPAQITPIKTTIPPAPAQQFVTVKSGDNLSKIASDNRLSLAQIVHLNPQIHNINLIYPGQKVRVR